MVQMWDDAVFLHPLCPACRSCIQPVFPPNQKIASGRVTTSVLTASTVTLCQPNHPIRVRKKVIKEENRATVLELPITKKGRKITWRILSDPVPTPKIFPDQVKLMANAKASHFLGLWVWPTPSRKKVGYFSIFRLLFFEFQQTNDVTELFIFSKKYFK